MPQTACAIARAHPDADGTWNLAVIENIGVGILEESLILQVSDAGGQVIWDALEYNSGICHTMIDQMANRMLGKYPSLSGGLTHKEYDVTRENRLVGRVKIGYYGPFYYTESDFFFIGTINKLLIIVAVISLGLSLVFGFLLAGGISSPVAAVTRLAGRIAGGEYALIKNVKTSTREVHELIHAINHLSGTIGRQEPLRKRLTADVAHELRTPLASLQGELEAMLDGVRETSPARLQSCHEEIIRLGNLIHDMEILSKLDAENAQLHKSKFRLKELVQTVLERHASLYQDKGITVTCDGFDGEILADREKISQVLLNLITNACKFTPSGGRIGIELRRQPGLVLFSIQDNGPGIPADELPYIFERFYRVDKSRTRANGGSGIGLTIVREIVKAHNWQIRVRSTVGTGTTVFIEMVEPG